MITSKEGQKKKGEMIKDEDGFIHISRYQYIIVLFIYKG
jgi:hypothetical protein